MRSTLLAASAVLSAALTAAAAAPPAVAAGDPKPPLWQFLTAERYAQALVQAGVLALRDQVDFTYSHITADFPSGTIALHGLKIYPEVPWPTDTPCVVEAQRARIASASLESWDSLRLRIGLQGATASLGCVAPPLTQQVQAVGMDRIAMDHFDIDLDYRIGPGRLLVTADTTLDGLAALSLNVDFAYFAIGQDDTFKALLSHASLTIEDDGLLAKAKQVLPPDASDPDAIAGQVQAGLAEALRPPLIRGQPAQPLGEPQQAFINNAVREVRRFLAEPGSLTVESHPPQPVALDVDTVEDPHLLFARLQPTVSRRPTPDNPVIAAAQLEAALNAPDTLSDAERLTIGKALVSGAGAPRAKQPGRALLEPLANAGNGEAALALARSMQDDDPAAAYLLALEAGEQQIDGAVALLDVLEQALPTPEVLAIQADGLQPPAEGAYGSLQAMRSRAIAHMSGFGARRSYRRAFYWATLASAAGDRAAAKLIEDIENRMRYRGEAVTAAWQREAGKVSQAALAAWLDRGLAARYGSNP